MGEIIFITGTNTDVGKTYASAALVDKLRERGTVAMIKPVQTGEKDGEGDIYTIRELVGGDLDIFECTRYPEPLAPNIAARRAGMAQLEMGDVEKQIKELAESYDYVLVEGAGGVLVRLADDWTLADLAQRMQGGVVVVTSTGLGSLNAAELTVRELQHRGLRVLGLIGGRVSAEPDFVEKETIEALPQVTGVPYLGSIPEANFGARELDLW
ncbi:MAG: dethiobiotin synthase [Corynebacterium sp.]|nr:dethiobiotin synthase [Corynebacterium sp.]